MMKRYTSQQGVDIIKIYHRNSESVASTLRALRPIYGRNNRPCISTIERLVDKIESTGIVQNFLVPVDKKFPIVSRILLPLRLQLKKAQMCLSYVVLKRWASL